MQKLVQSESWVAISWLHKRYVRHVAIADRVSDLVCVAHQILLMLCLLAVLLAGSF